MSQMTHFYPLEKLKPRLLIWLQLVTLHLLRGRAWARRVWAAMINEQYHHGAGLLMVGDSLQGQRSLAKVVGGMERAMIVQKLHEWLEFNKAEGNYKNKKDGCWWTYNSYVEWCKAHFDWMSADSMGRHVRALEKMGVIRTRQMKKRDRSKWYTIDYGRLNSLAKQAGESLALMPARSRRDRAIDQAHRANVNSHHADSHDDSSSKPKNKTKPETQVSSAATVPQVSAPDQPRALTEADSDSHSVSLSSEESTTGQNATTAMPPSSATPPIDHEAAQTWNTGYHQLLLILDHPQIQTWLKASRLYSHAQTDGTDIYTVMVPTAHAQDQFQHRYYRKIHRTFEGLANRPVKIVFEVGT